jgi:hypothetical protein
VTVVVLAFYATVGFIVPRLAFAAIPPLLVAAGAAALATACPRPEGQRRICCPSVSNPSPGGSSCRR